MVAACFSCRAAPASGDPSDPGSTDAIDRFSRPDLRDDAGAARVLLMSFDHSSALNLQHVSHDVVFYSPLWGDDQNGAPHAPAAKAPSQPRVASGDLGEPRAA